MTESAAVLETNVVPPSITKEIRQLADQYRVSDEALYKKAKKYTQEARKARFVGKHAQLLDSEEKTVLQLLHDYAHTLVQKSVIIKEKCRLPDTDQIFWSVKRDTPRQTRVLLPLDASGERVSRAKGMLMKDKIEFDKIEASNRRVIAQHEADMKRQQLAAQQQQQQSEPQQQLAQQQPEPESPAVVPGDDAVEPAPAAAPAASATSLAAAASTYQHLIDAQQQSHTQLKAAQQQQLEVTEAAHFDGVLKYHRTKAPKRIQRKFWDGCCAMEPILMKCKKDREEEGKEKREHARSHPDSFQSDQLGGRASSMGNATRLRTRAACSHSTACSHSDSGWGSTPDCNSLWEWLDYELLVGA